MRHLNLDQLRTLIAIADLGSFSAAAQALHLAQPTVSLHVSELESRLDVPLLVRAARRVQPTPAGAELVERGRRLLRDVDEAIEATQRRHAGLEGRVRLGVSTTSVVVDLLPPVFELLTQRYPGIEISPSFVGSDGSVAGLQAGTVDVAVVSLPQPAVPGLRFTPWLRHEMRALVPAHWPVVRRATPAWLAQRPLIMNEPGSRMQTLTMEWFAKAGFAPRARIEHNYDTAMRGLVQAGYGAALLPLMDDASAYASERVRVLPLTPRLVRHLVVGLRASEPREGPAARVAETLLSWSPGQGMEGQLVRKAP
ncbi:LysR family transcriptional regulator [Xenophilus arseniciresistens]|uniref:LysR family transcriptional regulator n=1 Tax=Xenophilus arseniciresistens TaxID=1283306 RepID=A0AAE3NCG5_9BURK|nr:LysR family transcriptional regulator [Xenophilus arseniciresistens]MDA7419028.1 LysR family transcriptional regulator [Xenophilus arseniciresistens]